MRVTNLLSSAVKCLQLQGGLCPPDPLTRGSAPGHRWGHRPRRARHILSVPVVFLTGNEPCCSHGLPELSAKDVPGHRVLEDNLLLGGCLPVCSAFEQQPLEIALNRSCVAVSIKASGLHAIRMCHCCGHRGHFVQ